MNLLWLNSDQMGCGTYRAYVPALSLEAAGHTNHFLQHEKARISNPTRELEGMHTVVFQRAVDNTFLDWLKTARRLGVRTVFEMDDDLFHVPRHNPASWLWNAKLTQRLLREMLDAVDGVVVSTKPLRESLAHELGWPISRITVCPNHVHAAVWGEEVIGSTEPFSSTSVVVGWQGSATHDVDFKTALPALQQLVRDTNVMVRFFGCVPLSVKGALEGEHFQWAKGVPFEKYPTMLKYMGFDIGIAPLTDSKFNRAKSNLKWLEYSVLGVPCVASRVYPYERSISHGETGFLAATPEEWYQALRRLVDDVAWRQRMGQTARAHVWATHGPAQARSWWEPLGVHDGQPDTELRRTPGSSSQGDGGARPAYGEVAPVCAEGQGEVSGR